MRREAFFNDGRIPNARNAYHLLVWDTTRYTDLKKLLIGGTAHTNNISVQMSGGNLNTKFSAGVNYYNETTVFPGNTGDNRINVNSNFSHRSSDNKLDILIKTSYASDKSNLISQDLTQYLSLAPVIPKLYDSSRHLNFYEAGFPFINPLINLERKYKVI